ncbi:SGNH/GDSL hydrolase family protein [Cryobacterium roopkundense]|uniref:Lysophospholipase L1-like esterase n=1 Tax=Cryobacterium roopkundense TaxID=1001240 RepID=A0A7W9E5Y3_9MICO|nr:SGNH/GDSL hydrolase family protein [Cryobacterium roopkundense]MBB5642430.1 lysophospholipase L1-like esterase [Cryobacterium roopkundense]
MSWGKKRSARNGPESTRTRRIKLGIVGLTTVAALGLTVLALSGPPPASSYVLPPASTPTATAPPERTKVAFIGDSYTGRAGVDPVNNYIEYLADMHPLWDVVPFGEGGTGYTNPGQAAENETTFLGRVPAVAESAPDIVFVQGGLNDQGPVARTQSAAAELFAAVQAQAPSARIVAVGPSYPPAGNRDSIDRARTAIAAAAASAGVSFVDPAAEGWLPDPDDNYVDGIHLSPKGNEQFAALLNTSLQAQKFFD